MTKSVEITLTELDDLIFLSFRYALGRSTYVTHLVADLISKYKECLYSNTINSICNEIIIANGRDNIGDAVDRDIWLKLLGELDAITR
jgi:hypothetical protein